jgi:phosphoserine phosphatase
VQLQSPQDVWVRIERAASETPGGIVATDADGTLWSGDVGEDLFHAFLDHGRVDAPADEALRREAREHELSDAGTGMEVARTLYTAYRGGRYPEERICEVMTWCFGGWTEEELGAFARQVVESAGLAARFHQELHGLIDRLRRAGIETFLVSASPVAVVQVAGARAGFDEAHIVAARPLVSALAVPRGSGRIQADVDRPIPYGPGKVRRLHERIGSGRPLLAAFGDNAFDVALLAEATVGVAVRPKDALRARAGEVPGLVELIRVG